MQDSDKRLANLPSDDQTIWLVLVIPAAMCLIAIADMPYGFYQLTRWVVTIAGLLGAYWMNFKGVLGILLVIIALLFNPLFPIHLEREQWAPIDIITAVLFIISAWRLIVSRNHKDQNE